MKRPMLLVCLFACVVVLGVIIWLLRHPASPAYKGRPLTAWVDDGYRNYSSTPAQVEQANEAVRAVGTNALAFWLGLLGNTNDSAFIDFENSLFGRGSRFHRPDSSDRLDEAFCALYILGADANPAIPRLTELMAYRQIRICEFSTILLAALGSAGVQVLTNALADPKVEMRHWVAATLGGWNGKPPNYGNLERNGGGPWEWPEPVMKAIVPALVRGLKDRELNVRVFSAQSLGYLGKDAVLCVPALTDYLRAEADRVARITGLEALARFGTAAKSSRSEIIPFLSDSDFQTRRSATNALEKIDPQAAAQAGMK